MIYFIGLGLNPPYTIPWEGVKLSDKCAIKYLDNYTTKIDSKLVDELKKQLGAEPAGRSTLEDFNKIINLAKNQDICIYIYGDPFIATTHLALKIEAIKRAVAVKSIYASSFLNALLGETGLHIYKIGFIGTLLANDKPSALYIYRNVKRSLEIGRHSILLVYSGDNDLTLKEALGLLISAESNYKEGVFGPSAELIIAGDLGKEEEEIITGKIKDLGQIEYNHRIFVIVVPAELHFTEEESLHTVATGNPSGNTVKTLLRQRTEQIIYKTTKAIDSLTTDNEITDLIRNSELYLKDASEFLIKGEEETALMQAAYSEGLIDALRFLGKKNINWQDVE
ncbi:MAG: diphthine synthase [Nitrososphaerota archaeon]|jgi:diphthine synthase|nr:diphthine synthase [Nitrososphaerota archaeon]MDG6927594.1 diphthine synthase [Nitrososphaerota archaeon]MDG6929917.1 diphthine synthase [Nitrososphaerota archaeon]MDG6931633.1 diphthine synthase [Nitrososphaerota archaeon]MDG6935950.1 diphthine synthase [Nitrososphaerota archaeon]